MTHVGVQSGSGVVGRYGEVVVLVADRGADDPSSAALLDAVAAAEPSRIAWQLLPVLAQDTVPFGVVTPVEGGWHLLLHGPVRAVLEDSEVSGSDAATWVDRVVRGTAVSLTLAQEGGVTPDPWSSLRDGVVQGIGVLVSAGGPQESPAPVVAPVSVVEPAVVDARATADLAPTTPVQAADNATMAVRLDQVGALVADDGTRTILDRTYVLGRDPSKSESVRAGTATPIVVDDPDNLISRVQVTVRVDGGVVTVTDESSANGTFVAAPGAPDWDRVVGSATLPPGWSMRLGKRVFSHVAGS